MDEPRTAAQTVQERLALDILAGRLKPGARLKLGEIGQAYTSGMSPLREALAGLAGQGLVVQEGQRGFRVAPASHEDLRDVVNMRAMLEISALRASIAAGDVDWEAGILSAYHKLRRHPRTERQLLDEPWEQLHRAFHLSLLRACGSARLFAYCGGLIDQFDRYRRIAVLARRTHPRLRALNAEIVKATVGRDADAACALLTEHIVDSGKAVGEMLYAARPDIGEGAGKERLRSRPQ